MGSAPLAASRGVRRRTKRCRTVAQVVAGDELVPAVEAMVAKPATKSPLGLARMKLLVNDDMEQLPATALRLKSTLREAHASTTDMGGGLAAFEVKRESKVTGH